MQEFILLSDVLGLSLLVDSIDHPKPKGSTEGTVLGLSTHAKPNKLVKAASYHKIQTVSLCSSSVP